MSLPLRTSCPGPAADKFKFPNAGRDGNANGGLPQKFVSIPKLLFNHLGVSRRFP